MSKQGDGSTAMKQYHTNACEGDEKKTTKGSERGGTSEGVSRAGTWSNSRRGNTLLLLLAVVAALLKVLMLLPTSVMWKRHPTLDNCFGIKTNI